MQRRHIWGVRAPRPWIGNADPTIRSRTYWRGLRPRCRWPCLSVGSH